VQFIVDGSAYGAPAALSSGVASLTTSTLTHGYHTVAAAYPGDGNFNGSTNSLGTNQLINTTPVAATNYTMTALRNQPTNLSATKLARKATDADGDALSVTAVSDVSAQGGTVSLSAGTITYLPPTNYVGADTFTYMIQETFGATDIGAVAVTVNPGNFSEPITSLTQLPDGNMEIQASGIPSFTYWIQASTNLDTWEVISTNTADTNGVIIFDDLNATNYTSRFYRTAAP